MIGVRNSLLRGFNKAKYLKLISPKNHVIHGTTAAGLLGTVWEPCAFGQGTCTLSGCEMVHRGVKRYYTTATWAVLVAPNARIDGQMAKVDAYYGRARAFSSPYEMLHLAVRATIAAG